LEEQVLMEMEARRIVELEVEEVRRKAEEDRLAKEREERGRRERRWRWVFFWESEGRTERRSGLVGKGREG
jgi:hypothetical protein